MYDAIVGSYDDQSSDNAGMYDAIVGSYGRDVDDFSGTEEAYGLDPSRYTVTGIDEHGQPIVVERDPGVITGPGSVTGSGGGVGAVTGTSGSTTAPTGGSRVGNKLKDMLKGEGKLGDYLGLLAFLHTMRGKGGKTNTTAAINPNKYTASRPKLEMPAYTPYSGSSAPVMGRKNFGDVTYTQNAAAGGLMGFARGGTTKSPRYLQGITDGMADKLSTNIDGKQPAALSHGEFVIPADVVSHLGNGNSEAGAKQLYKMMDRIRQARTGNKKQGKRINPEKFTPGGIAGYAGGGVVAFTAGGATTTGGPTGDGTTTTESNLSSWAAPGITDYIQRGTALANQPYQAYTGPLTAGTSPLQQQAFTAAANLQTPAAMQQGVNMAQSAGTAMGNLQYSPTTATNQFTAPGAYTPSNIGIDQFNTANMQRYMNPYMQMALDPQLAEARRQSDITQMGNASKLAQAGAYGGSRGALMQSEAQRNLGSNLANITGQGYNTAFNNAADMFNKQQSLGLQAQQANEQSRQFGANQGMTAAQSAAQYGQAAQTQNMQDRQFGANYGLNALQGQLSAGTALGGLGAQQNQMGIANLNAQSAAGATQRGIEQEGIDAQFKQYEQERLDPYKQIQFVQSLYKGLPVDTSSSGYNMSSLERLMEAIAGGGAVSGAVD